MLTETRTFFNSLLDRSLRVLWTVQFRPFRLGEIQWFFRFHGPPTPGQGPCGFDKGRSLVSKIKYRKFGESMCDGTRPKKIDFFLEFSIDLDPSHKDSPNFWFYLTTRDRPLSKPHGPWPAGVGGPWNPKSLNLLIEYSGTWIPRPIKWLSNCNRCNLLSGIC